jgi:hypothetical protein
MQVTLRARYNLALQSADAAVILSRIGWQRAAEFVGLADLSLEEVDFFFVVYVFCYLINSCNRFKYAGGRPERHKNAKRAVGPPFFTQAGINRLFCSAYRGSSCCWWTRHAPGCAFGREVL